MRTLVFFLLFVMLSPMASLAAEGLISVKSNHDVKTTADRMEGVLAEKGMTLFARIDHASGAEKVGKSLAPTELLIFGNPKVGTPLMQCAHTVAVDLPQKVLVWQDSTGDVWLSYNDPKFLAVRHEIKGCDEVLKKVAGALKIFADKATGADQ